MLGRLNTDKKGKYIGRVTSQESHHGGNLRNSCSMYQNDYLAYIKEDVMYSAQKYFCYFDLFESIRAILWEKFVLNPIASCTKSAVLNRR